MFTFSAHRRLRALNASWFQRPPRLYVRVDDVPRPASLQNIYGVTHASNLRLARRFDRAAGAVRREDDVVELQQGMIRPSAVEREHVDPLKHVECRARDAL